MRPPGRVLSLLLAALLLASCGGERGGDDGDETLYLDRKECSELSGNFGNFALYDRIPLELKKGRSLSPFDVTPGTERAGDEGRLGRLSCKQGIVMVSQYAGNPHPTVPTVISRAMDLLYRASAEGGGPEGWILTNSSYGGFSLLEDSTITALDQLPIAEDATRPLHPGALPDLVVEGVVEQAGETCAFPGEVVDPSAPITIANRGRGSGPDVVQLEVDGRTRMVELNRHLEPGELVDTEMLRYLTLDQGQTATVDFKHQVKEANEDNNSFTAPVGPPLTCVRQ